MKKLEDTIIRAMAVFVIIACCVIITLLILMLWVVLIYNVTSLTC